MNDMNLYSRGVKCPQCGCRELQSVSMTDNTVTTTGNGYSGSKGCLGFLLFGPCGLMCGNCGNSQTTTVNSTTKLFWVCSHCGHRFRNLEDLQSELVSTQNKLPLSWVCAIIFWAFDLVLLYCMIFKNMPKEISGWMWFFFIAIALLGVFMIVAVKNQIMKLENEYEELSAKTRD